VNIVELPDTIYMNKNWVNFMPSLGWGKYVYIALAVLAAGVSAYGYFGLHRTPVISLLMGASALSFVCFIFWIHRMLRKSKYGLESNGELLKYDGKEYKLVSVRECIPTYEDGDKSIRILFTDGKAVSIKYSVVVEEKKFVLQEFFEGNPDWAKVFIN